MSKISGERKALFYVGSGLMVIGFILFFSVFVVAAISMSNPYSEFDGISHSFGNGIFGFILIFIGQIIKNIGAKGAAGSGVILDPEQAREDLKPYSEAAGGMINDAISHIDVVDKLTNPHEEKEVVKVRCRNCKSLNDEDAKFCKNCGMEL